MEINPQGGTLHGKGSPIVHVHVGIVAMFTHASQHASQYACASQQWTPQAPPSKIDPRCTYALIAYNCSVIQSQFLHLLYDD